MLRYFFSLPLGMTQAANPSSAATCKELTMLKDVAVRCRDCGGRAEGRAEQPGGQSVRTRVHASEEGSRVVLLTAELENTSKLQSKVETLRTEVGVAKNTLPELEERKCRHRAQASDFFSLLKKCLWSFRLHTSQM